MSISVKPRFITFEGIDGCGKSTQAKLLIQKLENEGKEVIFVREPGGTDISEQVRNILLHSGGDEMTGRTEALLMTASRAQLTKEVIIPSLDNGKWVVADRYADSTLAYQGGGRTIDLEWLIELNQFATFALQPDLTFFVDVLPEIGFERQGGSPDRIERAGLDFQANVRQMYLKLTKRFSDRIVLVDGNHTIDNIQDVIISTLIKRNFI